MISEKAIVRYCEEDEVSKLEHRFAAKNVGVNGLVLGIPMTLATLALCITCVFNFSDRRLAIVIVTCLLIFIVIHLSAAGSLVLAASENFVSLCFYMKLCNEVIHNTQGPSYLVT